MIKRFGLALAALLLLAPASYAQGISQKVAVCNPLYTGRCISVNSDGSVPTSPASGVVADVNVKQLGGASINTGAGAVGTGTQRTVPGSTTSTDGSSTVTLGGTFQTALAASTTRKGCTVQNPTTATEVLYVHFGTLGSATTANSFTLGAGAAISCAAGGVVLSDAVNVTAPTLGHAFTLTSQ